MGLVVATFYWRRSALSLRAENRALLESLERLRQANATDHELQNKVKELEQAHQFDSYKIQQLLAKSQKLEPLSNLLLNYVTNHNILMTRLSALEDENYKMKADYAGKPRVPRVGAYMGMNLALVECLTDI